MDSHHPLREVHSATPPPHLESSPRQRHPRPAFSRPPSLAPALTDHRYPTTPPITRHRTPGTNDSAPITPPRRAATSRRSQSLGTPSTLYRAIGTALPLSPTPHSNPRLDNEDDALELTPITPPFRRSDRTQDHESPFSDRHSLTGHSNLWLATHTALPETPPLQHTPTLNRSPHQLRSPFANSAPRFGDIDAEEEEKEEVVTISDDDPFEYQAITLQSGLTPRETQSGHQSAPSSSPSRNRIQEQLEKDEKQRTSQPVSVHRRSLYTNPVSIPISTYQQHADLIPPAELDMSTNTAKRLPPAVDPIRPTFRGLFTICNARDLVVILLPATLISIATSVILPYMAHVNGDAFVVFGAYPLDTRAADGPARMALNHGVSDTSLKLFIAGLLAILLNYFKNALWTCFGETVTARLRERVYLGVATKRMEWFDLGMGMQVGEDDEDAVGAGGLMAKFTKETDDVRLGTSLAMGSFISSFFTFALCFALAMKTAPILALVTLSTIPAVVLVQIVTQVIVQPLYATERRAFAEASTNIERATAAISTVKVHNAQKSELDRFADMTSQARASLAKQAVIWGASMGLTDFFTLSTFVVGFWYGAKCVRDGTVTSGAVMTVFWACLLAASNLQSMVPALSTITKAKMSMASLMTVIREAEVRPASRPLSVSSPLQTTFNGSASKLPGSLTLNGLRPPRCRGEFTLRNITFAYPSRPDALVLRDVSLFIPPGEMTFIVGGSGSGKSTIAQILLRLYDPDSGELTLDDQSFPHLDSEFTSEHIAAVQQGCIPFDMSVHDNVAMGLAGAGHDSKTGSTRRPADVTRQEVEDACRLAMIHDFVIGLPDGYDTKLGTGGSSLSGGQRQRLAIARAIIREPTVLILDEATSALDATSRVVVFENVKRWRKNKTTIVITHDLSQIVSDDFIYVMKDGVVAEQGFRSELMKRTPVFGQTLGVFAGMAAEQAIEPLAPKLQEWKGAEQEELLDDAEAGDENASRRGSLYLGILDDYTLSTRTSMIVQNAVEVVTGGRRAPVLSMASKRLSSASLELQRPVSSARPINNAPRSSHRHSCASSILATAPPIKRKESHVDLDTDPPEKLSSGEEMLTALSKTSADDLQAGQTSVELPVLESEVAGAEPLRGIIRLIWYYFPTLPSKTMVLFGLLAAIAHGMVTPLWSNYLSKLMSIVAEGGQSSSLMTIGGIVLGLSGAEAVANFFQEYLLYSQAAEWSNTIRAKAYEQVLKQDKAWFDRPENAPERLVQRLVKDGDDLRNLIAFITAKCILVIVMIGFGLIWALVVQWRMTLVGLSLIPLFAGSMLLQTSTSGIWEERSKAKREAVAKVFYETVSNIRGIRAMALGGVFTEKFQEHAAETQSIGYRAAFIISIGGGVANGLPILSQALFNWAGMRFMLDNYTNYATMLQAYSLVIFSVTFAAAALDFLPGIAKVKYAARDLNRLFVLSDETSETAGELRYPITGNISFENVSFSYPTRPDMKVLDGLTFKLAPGECVAVVGPSGSGKSTVAALLQRLYEPTGGQIKLDRHLLSQAGVKWLRNHVAVVSQSANLFDASVTDNIAYGCEVPIGEIHRAAKAANIHEFIMSLPSGYDTKLGENASLISGGQAQRLQIARALVRRSNILILDECTSALDVDNQRAVLDTIIKIKETRTTVFITHSVEAMKRCDRIICMGDGRVAEEGPFDQLIRTGGFFTQLMQTGEWE